MSHVSHVSHGTAAPRPSVITTARRAALVGATALTAALALAGPASAHAEVEADTPRALATGVTLTFVSEAESDSAGFTELRVVLPEGISPGDVSLDDAPEGWKLTAAGNGYTVAGPALKPGVDAEHSIKVKQLPNARELVFKTVETYSDGEISRWIELPTGGKEPEQPAPVLKLKAAAAGAASLAPSPSASTPTSANASANASADVTRSPTPSAVRAAGDDDGGMPTGAVVGGVAAVVVAVGGGAWWLAGRRRRSAATQS
ncbi:DUF1775 domain-containing protein [Streptomyces sp. NPDC051985]|uniref:DUF1775 domain-containing protein n=1 Tax=Streptomyces sp. NPDC051985 TaxID=3155807 RepID=UPI003427A44F